MINRTEKNIMKNWSSTENPVVSVCCTTYNHENYISDAIDGFLIQDTDFPFEVVVRDDCSTDKTAKIIKQYVDKYPNIIKPIYETENQFSKGVKPMPVVYKKAVGMYFALCEGDDYWTDPLKLKKQVTVFRKNSDISICFHSAKEVDVLKNTNKIICQHYHNDSEVSISNVILGRGGYMPTASLMFKNYKINEMLNSFKNAPIGDFFTQVYMASLGGAFFQAESMCVYRRNAIGSWTEAQQSIVNKKLYSFAMVKSISQFSRHFKKSDIRIPLYKVLFFYSKNYIYLTPGLLPKIKSIINLLNSLHIYNKFTFLKYITK